MYRMRLALIVCALLAIPSFSQLRAVAINGSTGFGGSAIAAGRSGVGTTTITFSANWNSLIGTGIYSAIPQTVTVFNNFSFTGDGTAAVLMAPALPLWSFSSGGNNYSFNLLTLTN